MVFRALISCAWLLVVVPASGFGHAEVKPAASAPGSRGTVTIQIPHGCSGETGAVADTTRISTHVPRGFTALRPRSPRGWRVRVTAVSGGQRVEWTRTAARSTVLDFPIGVRFPMRAGAFAFPTVQYCGKRSVAWIERSVGGEEPEYPVPTFVVG